MGFLQSVLGKWLVPDSKVILLQTLVNPMYPFTALGTNQLLDDLKESAFEESRLLAQTVKEQDIGLNKILDALKPKLVNGLSELADSGVLNKIRPLINLTIENVNDADYSEGPANTTLLGGQLKYDMVDLVEYDAHTKQVHHSSNRTQLGEFIDLLLSKKQANSSEELTDGDVIANVGSLIDKEDDKQEPAAAITVQPESNDVIVNRTAAAAAAVEFREMQSEQQSNRSEYDGLGDPSSRLNQTIADAAKSEDNHQIAPLDAAENSLQQPDQSNRTASISNASNGTESADEDDDNDGKPIVSLVICDDNNENCEEEELDTEYLNNKTSDGTEYNEPGKTPVKRPNKLRTALKKLLHLLKKVIERPTTYLYERIAWLGNIVVRDARLIAKMIRVLFGSRSTTCRHKFLCMFSSFISLHLPDFVKSNMPPTLENYYFMLLEGANKYEFLNALISGYVGFDCNEFYSGDRRCLE